MARIARRFFQSKKKAQQSYLKRIQDPSKKRPALVIIDGPGTPPPPPPEPSKLGFAAKINNKSCLLKSKKRNLILKQGLKSSKNLVFPSMPGSSSIQPPTKKHMKGV